MEKRGTLIGRIWAITDPIRLHAVRRRTEITCSLLQAHRSDIVLDLGCGDGYQISKIVKHVSCVVGLDLSRHNLEEGKRKLKKANFLCASSENLPFRSRIFDKVTCLELLEHLENPPRTLTEIDRVLKKGGVLVVSLPYREQIYMTPCIHCGKLTPLWGHLHSFDENKLSSILPENYVVLQREFVGTTAASYPFFSFLPTQLWKIVDRFFTLLPSISPSWFVNKIRKT